MEAPLYPAATAFIAPKRVPRFLSTKETAIADLQAISEAWAIVTAEIPNVEARIGNDMIKPHLGNFSFQSLIQFGVVKSEALARIDERLKSLGER